MDQEFLELIIEADRFAAEAHAGQTRQYTGEPYINHPREVMFIVASVPHDKEMLAAALLHDVIEMTNQTGRAINAKFGDVVAGLVEEVTEEISPEHSCRADHKSAFCAKLALASRGAKTIKLADTISNVSSIGKRAPEFAKVYLPEKAESLAALHGGNPALMMRARMLIEDGVRQVFASEILQYRSEILHKLESGSALAIQNGVRPSLEKLSVQAWLHATEAIPSWMFNLLNHDWQQIMHQWMSEQIELQQSLQAAA